MAMVSLRPTSKYKVTKTFFGLQQNTTRGLIASWTFNAPSTQVDYYNVVWKHRVKLDEPDENGQDTIFTEVRNVQVKNPYDEYHADQEDTCIKVFIYPISVSVQRDGISYKHWNDGDYVTTEKEWTINFGAIPGTPSLPTVTITDSALKIELDDVDMSSTASVQFQIVKDHDEQNPVEPGVNVPANATHISYDYKDVKAGYTYKVRCRAYKDGIFGQWTSYTESVSSLPEVPIIKDILVYKDKSVKLVFSSSKSAETYTIEWISEETAKTIQWETLSELFDHSNATRGNVTVNHKDLAKNSEESEDLVYHITAGNNLQQGSLYYVRIKASGKQNNESSKGSELNDLSLKTFIYGTEPKAPTTWSSATKAIVGEDEYVTLYWAHNSEDKSILTESKLELVISGNTYECTISDVAYQSEYITAEKYDYEKNATRVCKLKMSSFEAGSDVKWRVKTAGAIMDDQGKPKYGEWSVTRTINVYTKPTMTLNVMSYGDITLPVLPEIFNGESVQLMTSFPLIVYMETGNAVNHTPIGYSLNIISTSEEPYNTSDLEGNITVVDTNTKVYSKYIIPSDEFPNDIFEEIVPGDVNLKNNVIYQITGTVTMSSGVTVSSTRYFKVGFEEDIYDPKAEIAIDTDNLTVALCPYVDLEDDSDNVEFIIHRREYDGKFTKIASNISNKTWFIDPHPALNTARYRITARSKTTGSISFCDTPLIPIGEFGVVIQWDEPWQKYESSSIDQSSRSMLKLYYNIRKSFSNDVDVSFVNYMGREHPVSYYGTHKGEKMTWSVEIDKTDKETLYAIRRLSRWAGDVYVREPSGVGYWANIKVSYNEDYDSLVVPISFDITRVEGGI